MDDDDPRHHKMYKKMVKRFLDQDPSNPVPDDDYDTSFWRRQYGGGHGASSPNFSPDHNYDGSEFDNLSSGYGGYNRRTPFGSIGGDSNCSYYLHPGGSSVLTCD